MTPKQGIALGVAVLALVVFVIFNPMVVINAGNRGVVLHWGAVEDKVLGEGIHWVTPISNDVREIEVRTQKEEVEVGAASKDLQTVSAKVALNFHLDEQNVNKLYQKVGQNYNNNIIAPAIQEAIKAATAKFTAEELITKREEVKMEAKNLLRERLIVNYIVVDELSIVNFDFSAQFNKAIEAKVTAEQDALAQKNKLAQVKYEAEQRVAQAQAEATAIKLQSDAAQNERYITLKSLEVTKSAVERWDGRLPTQMVPGSALPFLGLNLK